MSLTMIAMTGIFLGFLCLMVGFFMDGSESDSLTQFSPSRTKKMRSLKKRVVHRRVA